MVLGAKQKCKSEHNIINDPNTNTTITSNNTITVDKQQYVKLEKENARLKIENLILQEKVALLTYKRFVYSSEKEEDNQPSLFNEDEVAKTETDKSDEDETAETTVKEHTRKKGGRKPLPENLRREVHLNDLSDEEKHCTCGCGLIRIGEDITEKLVIIPEQVYVEQTITAKYVCPCCKAAKGDADAPQAIHNAPTRPTLLPGSIASYDREHKSLSFPIIYG